MEESKVLKRTITPEIKANQNRDMETVLDNYRENLRDYGVTDEAAIERFVSEERCKMQKEYESLDNGDCSSNIYHTPTDWEGIASKIKEQEVEQEDEISM